VQGPEFKPQYCQKKKKNPEKEKKKKKKELMQYLTQGACQGCLVMFTKVSATGYPQQQCTPMPTTSICVQK
jgi:hypothetical protein